jgi:hypothetical protein
MKYGKEQKEDAGSIVKKRREKPSQKMMEEESNAESQES